MMAAFVDPRLRNLDFIKKAERKKEKLELKRMMVSLCDQTPQAVAKLKAEADPQMPSISPAQESLCGITTEPPAKKVKDEKSSFFDDLFDDIFITKVEPPVLPMDKDKK